MQGKIFERKKRREKEKKHGETEREKERDEKGEEMKIKQFIIYSHNSLSYIFRLFYIKNIIFFSHFIKSSLFIFQLISICAMTAA